MESIAEVTTPLVTYYLRFDDQDMAQVEELQDALGILADNGEVYCLSFHRAQ